MNVYDFDNTIYKGDSTFDFYKFCLRRHIGIVKLFPSLLGAFTKYYVLKKGTKTQFKEVMYKFLTFVDTEKEVDLFWDSHIKNIKPWYKKQQKENDLIISASPEFLLKPAMKRLGIKRLIASQVSPVNGKYSGINCHGEEKVRLFRKKYNCEIEEFYSDSYSDTPLAAISKTAYMVKDDKIKKWN